VNVCAAPVASQAATQAPSNKTSDTSAAGDNFGVQLMQLLLAGDTPLVGPEPGHPPELAAKADDAESTDDEPTTSLPPGLSLLIQQMSHAVDEPADASATVSGSTSGTDSGATGVLVDLLEQIAAGPSASDDVATDATTADAMNLLAQAPPPPTSASAATPAAGPDAAPAMSAPLDATRSERLAEALDEQITWLADAARKDGPQRATISLHPAEWGSLQIRVDLGHDGRTTVKFDCETPQARQAIESSLGQLRELLSATVVTGAAPRFELSGGFGHSQSGSWRPGPQAAGVPEEGEPVERLSITRRPLGLLDQFA